MTTAQRDDIEETKRVLKNITNVSPADNTWLRHRANSQAAVIDVMIFQGKFTTEQIQLFDDYIKRMFERRNLSLKFHPNKTKKWLTWLAKGLISKGQTIFYIES